MATRTPPVYYPSPSWAEDFMETSKNYLVGNGREAGSRPDMDTPARLQTILTERSLHALFQPICGLGGGDIHGYEGLIRGPSDSPLHAPISLFRAAEQHGLLQEVETLAREVVIRRFVELSLPGKLFLNVSPEVLLQNGGDSLNRLKEMGLPPERVVIELTENQPTYNYALLREAALHYRAKGFEIAIDDLGEGFSSLRLWSEIHPDYVKIDMHFIQGINRDPVKLQFTRSIQQIAENSFCRTIAEGIETSSELRVVKELGIAFGQGYHLARPSNLPALTLPAEVMQTLGSEGITVYPQVIQPLRHNATARRLLRESPCVTPATLTETVYDLFKQETGRYALPVVDKGIPVGLINRYALIDRYARPFQRELYGHKPCRRFMDSNPLVVDTHMPIEELSKLVAEAERHYLFDGFIITENGRYLGMGTGHDLMREITQLQISAARYANPLTLLPGNVPITEHIERLLESGARFTACYCDLDYFKPYNDVYGFRRGDEVIQFTGQTLAKVCAPERDFLGHIGGDDFIILFQSPDWEERCHEALTLFSQAMKEFFLEEDWHRGGYFTEDRQGNKVLHPLTCLSIGAVLVEPGACHTHHEVAAAATLAKKMAKKSAGNSLFVDRRRPAPSLS